MGVTILGFCDWCLAADDARFVYPEANVGVAFGLVAALLAALLARISHKIAAQPMLPAGLISAQPAY